MLCKLTLSSALNVILYVTLFTFFFIFYLYGQVTEFIKGGTTFTRTFAKSEDGLPAPSFILCMPGIKADAAEKYGYKPALKSIYSDEKEKYKKFNKTPLEVAEEMSFLLDQDFGLKISFYLTESYSLHLGSNTHIKDGSINVKLIITPTGLCYLIQSNYKLKKSDSPWFYLQIRPTLSYFDSVQQGWPVQFYFVTNETWPGIYLASWQYLSVPRITVPLTKEAETMIEIMPSRIRFQDGIDDVLQCMMDLLTKKANCSQLCYPMLNSLMSEFGWPACKTYQEMQCIIDRGMFDPIIEADLGLCLRPTETMIFKVQDLYSRLSHTDHISIQVKYSTELIEVKEEIPIIGVGTFIGSIGGSLGLFLGFSCYDYISRLIKRLISLTQ